LFKISGSTLTVTPCMAQAFSRRPAIAGAGFGPRSIHVTIMLD